MALLLLELFRTISYGERRKEKMRFTVPGHPVPAVRMTQRGKFIKKAAGRYLAYKNQVAWEAKAAKRKAGLKMFTGAVEVIATAYIYGNKSGDADNLAKAFLDAMNGIVWIDDRQVTDLTIRKRKVSSKDEERAEIEVREVK
jgi:crossover junction endodeoxyribonuclease RusA